MDATSEKSPDERKVPPGGPDRTPITEPDKEIPVKDPRPEEKREPRLRDGDHE